MFLKILYFLCVAAEFAFVPLFLKWYWPDRCKQSFIYKMVCAALFTLSGYLAIKISGNTTPYASLILWGLVFGWLGDALLHALTEKKWPFISGVLAFLAGHIFYIVAIVKATKTTYPEHGTFRWYEILSIVLIVAFTLLIFVLKKYVKKENLPLLIGLSVYMVILTTMLVKAFRYVIGEWAYGINDNMFMVFLTVGLGALLFFLSDVSLGFIILVEKFKTRPMRIFNITTYFAAQILLAASIFFVQSQHIFNS